ncbi:alpha/beta hydrolase family protein [Streptomyces sp. NPDC002680]|uniref:alpha/beta hydrolase family protein n=1 Tax=Streptomyces sp. NPDC002680 TaxID=3364659 RepID=UPI0036B1A782
MESIVFDSPRERLFGTVFLPDGDPSAESPREGTLPGILFVHGLRSDQSGYLSRARVSASELRVVCLTFDLGGHGEHGSSFLLESLTPRDHLLDVAAAYDRLAGHCWVDPARIGVCGTSYGAYLAAMLVRQRPVRRLLMRAPAMHGDDEFTRPLGDLPGSRAHASTSMPAAALAEFSGETLILESAADEVIPQEVIQTYLKSSPGTRHRTISGATHALTRPEWKERFVREILEFFAEL